MLPSFHEELFDRVKKADLFNDKTVDDNFVKGIEVFRQNEKFSVDEMNWYNLYEVSFRTYLYINQKGWIRKFHNIRQLNPNTESFAKRYKNIKAEILLTKYTCFSDLELLENDNIPSCVSDIKISCFAFGKKDGVNISDFIKELTFNLPPSLFKNVSSLNKGLIPYFEISFLNIDFVVFDPFINLVSNWRKAKTIQGAIRNDNLTFSCSSVGKRLD